MMPSGKIRVLERRAHEILLQEAVDFLLGEGSLPILVFLEIAEEAEKLRFKSIGKSYAFGCFGDGGVAVEPRFVQGHKDDGRCDAAGEEQKREDAKQDRSSAHARGPWVSEGHRRTVPDTRGAANCIRSPLPWSTWFRFPGACSPLPPNLASFHASLSSGSVWESAMKF